MYLTVEEQAVLEGKKGKTLQKIMQTLVAYGDALGAERLVEIEGPGHFSWCSASPGVGPRPEFLKELLDAGLKSGFKFTLDPKGPENLKHLNLTPEQKKEFERELREQPAFDAMMLKLGLRDARHAFTCVPYLPEVGYLPKRNAILAWSESSCVIYANSVLAARTNRNGALMDILSNILGKTPLFGLITDEGRKAQWLIEVETTTLPHPQLLGAAIADKVQEDIPYITGLDRFLGNQLDAEAIDYLKELGAACAAIGAVGLFHVENLTPEAVDRIRDLLEPGYRIHRIDDEILRSLKDSYPNLWQDRHAKPRLCLIGCPHVSQRELDWWIDNILKELEAGNRDSVAVDTVICTAPAIYDGIKSDRRRFERVKNTGVKLDVFCPEAYMTNPFCENSEVITNSNKLRTFTKARFFEDDELLKLIISGETEPHD